jgi:hypothetical protein
MTGQHAHVKSSAEILQLFESVRALLENARALFLDLMEVSLTVDEREAIRLADLCHGKRQLIVQMSPPWEVSFSAHAGQKCCRI